MRHICLLVGLMALSSSLHAGMYKWVDEKGVVHYGDTIPSKYSQGGSSELGNSGIVVKKNSAALTPEQLAAQKASLEQKKLEEQKALEKQRRDQALLNTYTTEQEIDLVQERNLQKLSLEIDGMQVRIRSAQTRVGNYTKQAEAIKRNNRPIPPDLAKDLEASKGEIKSLEQSIGLKRREAEEVKQRFAADKARFLELRQADATVHTR